MSQRTFPAELPPGTQLLEPEELVRPFLTTSPFTPPPCCG